MNQSDKQIFQLFEGNIFHQRWIPTIHFFKNISLFLQINLTKLSSTEDLNDFKKPFFFSANSFNLISWYCKDHGERKKNSTPKELVEFIKRINEKPSYHKIILFCFPRILGFGFNPLSLYYCYNNKELVEIVFEVKNTFGDIHHYVLKNINKNGHAQKAVKKLFVSPFFKNKGYYYLKSYNKINKIIVEIKYFVNSKLSLKATLNAKKIKFTNLEIIKSLIRLRLFPGNVWLKIHIEAYKLWMKKLQIYKVPNQQHVKISKTEKIK
tara:strand:+ start:651 stop:1448 length:798 start_codon:yes stop_codon:yes gene_type:complete